MTMAGVQWYEELQQIGRHLDADRDLSVWRGGIVMPSEPDSTPRSLGAENSNGNRQQQRYQRGPATGSRQGTAGRQGSPGGAGPSRSASPLVLGDFASDYEKELKDLSDQYPGSWHCEQKDGFWLRVESALLRGYGGKALLCVAIPFELRMPRAWAFLKPPVCEYAWVGPRHTNFPDGSICAFHIDDGTWQPGDKLVSLLDLYSVWVVRHLHLMSVGRWPGPQAVPHSYERLSESRDADLCGCGSGAQYLACCKALDAKAPHLAQAVRMALLDRKPPPEVVRWARHGDTPPPLSVGLE